MRYRFKNALVSLLLLVTLTGCGNQSNSSSQMTEEVTVNSPPSITGSPAVGVVAGEIYTFTPNASDPDNDALVFSIENKPRWATFNVTTGILLGMPQAADEGEYTVILIAVSDGSASTSLPAFSITVTPEAVLNNAPTISGMPETGITAGNNYIFNPVASDTDGDPLLFTIINQPAWTDFDLATGTLSGNPENSDTGSYGDIVISVSDGAITTPLPAFTIVVIETPLPNNAPVISGTPATEITAGAQYLFEPLAQDADGDPLLLFIDNLPSWATFNTATGALSGNPINSDTGSYAGIVISVSDGAATDSLPVFAITVNAEPVPNSTPIISGTPSTEITAGTQYLFAPLAQDADGDSLLFMIDNVPSWANFDPATGVLSGNPETSDVGSYADIVISVSDGTDSASLPGFTLTVIEQETSELAFPGAEGFGAQSSGGRGGVVYTVTTLNDTGVGSLREAVSQPGARNIVFGVSGTINLITQLSIDHPYITIAGQTSPGGITIKGGRIKVRTHDVIIRSLRVRPGDDLIGMEPGNRDGLSIGDDVNAVYNVIVDHSSFTWAVDENGSNWLPSENITIQWCIFAEGLNNSIHPEGPHSMGYLIGPTTQKLSVHHNVFANNEHRNPVIKDAQSIEVINNVGYNWRSEGIAIGSTGNSTLHAINNYYMHGPNTTVRPAFYFRPSDLGQHRVYLKGNVDSKYRPSASQGDEWDVAHGWDPLMPSDAYLFEPSQIAMDTATTALTRVLDAAGAMSPQRDIIDLRIVDGIWTNTGAIIDSPNDVGGYPTIDSLLPPTDTDQDGMPDSWETENGLDPADASDGIDDRDADGYTELEEFLNSLM